MLDGDFQQKTTGELKQRGWLLQVLEEHVLRSHLEGPGRVLLANSKAWAHAF